METSFDKLLVNCVVWGLLFFRGTDLWGSFLNIRFLDATEEGGHSLSTEKFTSPAVHL